MASSDMRSLGPSDRVGRCSFAGSTVARLGVAERFLDAHAAMSRRTPQVPRRGRIHLFEGRRLRNPIRRRPSSENRPQRLLVLYRTVARTHGRVGTHGVGASVPVALSLIAMLVWGVVLPFVVANVFA